MSRPTNKHLFITIVLFVLTIFLFTGCSKADTSSKNPTKSKKLYVYNWSYYTPDSVIEAFEKEYGVDVVLDYFASNEEMFAKLKASGNAGYDIIFPSGDYVSIMMHEGMLEKIDTSKIPNLQYISDFALERAYYDPKMEYSVPYYLGATGIAVNTKMVKEYEKTWNIFANTKFADRMVMMDDMREVLGDALAYLGYSVNTTSAEELEKHVSWSIPNGSPTLSSLMPRGLPKALPLVSIGWHTDMQRPYSKSFLKRNGPMWTFSFPSMEARCISTRCVSPRVPETTS